jgi:hypothetical protein
VIMPVAGTAGRRSQWPSPSACPPHGTPTVVPEAVREAWSPLI